MNSCYKQQQQKKTEHIKQVTDFIEEPLNPEAKALIEEIRTIQKDIDYRKLEVVTIICMILAVIKHLKSYLETFITTK